MPKVFQWCRVLKKPRSISHRKHQKSNNEQIRCNVKWSERKTGRSRRAMRKKKFFTSTIRRELPATAQNTNSFDRIPKLLPALWHANFNVPLVAGAIETHRPTRPAASVSWEPVDRTVSKVRFDRQLYAVPQYDEVRKFSKLWNIYGRSWLGPGRSAI